MDRNRQMNRFIQFDAITWELLGNWHFLRVYNFRTSCLNSENSYSSSLEKVSFLLRTGLTELFLSTTLIKTVCFQTVPIWLLHTVHFIFQDEFRRSYDGAGAGLNYRPDKLQVKSYLLSLRDLYMSLYGILYFCVTLSHWAV